MKRNTILSFLLIGLCFLEWSCGGNCSDSGPYNARMSGISSVLYEVDSNTYYLNELSAEDTVKYSSLQISLPVLLSKVAQASFTGGSIIFADECDPPYPVLQNKVDSFYIAEVGSSENISNQFSSYGGSYGDSILCSSDEFINKINRSFSYYSSNEQFFLNSKKWEMTRRVSYLIQLIDEEGNRFETTTEPIFIKP